MVVFDVIPSSSRCIANVAENEEIEGKTVLVNVGGTDIFHLDLSSLPKKLFDFINHSNTSNNCCVYIGDSLPRFKAALKLVRENGFIDTSIKTSPLKLEQMILLCLDYGFPASFVEYLQDARFVALNTIMPEVQAELETNLSRRRMLLKKSLQKARIFDSSSAGTQSINAKIMRLKVAQALLTTVSTIILPQLNSNSNNSNSNNSNNNNNDNYEKIKQQFQSYMSLSLKCCKEGRNIDLPPQVEEELLKTQKMYDEMVAAAIALGIQLPSSSSSSNESISSKSSKFGIASAYLYTSKQTNDDLVDVNVGGERIYRLHPQELKQIGIFKNLLPSCTKGGNQRIYICEELVYFELCLRLIRQNGKLEDDEKMQVEILKQYRFLAIRYQLPSFIVDKLNSWLFAHLQGVGAANTANEEIKALRIAAYIQKNNPAKGNTPSLVASALAEAYVEKYKNNIDTLIATKKKNILLKAELNLHNILPVILTSMSVMKMSKEQQQSILQVISLLKYVLTEQGRSNEIPLLDNVISGFEKGISNATVDLKSQANKDYTSMYA